MNESGGADQGEQRGERDGAGALRPRDGLAEGGEEERWATGGRAPALPLGAGENMEKNNVGGTVRGSGRGAFLGL